MRIYIVSVLIVEWIKIRYRKSYNTYATNKKRRENTVVDERGFLVLHFFNIKALSEGLTSDKRRIFAVVYFLAPRTFDRRNEAFNEHYGYSVLILYKKVTTCSGRI